MSDAHHEHQSAIRTPKQLVVAVTIFFLVIVLGIILLVKFVTTTKLSGAGSDAQSSEAIAARLSPVADEGYTLKDASAPKVLLAGDAVYNATCAACHTSGAAGAPKLGDASAWAARIGKGQDVVIKNALQGLNAMPAKGGNPDLDDIEVARAVVYLVNQSGGKFKEPAAPAPAAPAATNASAAPAATQPAPGQAGAAGK